MSQIDQPQKSAYFVRKTPSSPVQNSLTNSNVSPAKPAVVLNIPGTRTSVQNSQLLTPIGIPSIDSFIGKLKKHLKKLFKQHFSTYFFNK
jgi:hypothetical protein